MSKGSQFTNITILTWLGSQHKSKVHKYVQTHKLTTLPDLETHMDHLSRRLILQRGEVWDITKYIHTWLKHYRIHRSRERISWMSRWSEQWSWWSHTRRGAKSLHVAKNVRHPLLFGLQLGPLPHLQLHTLPPLFFQLFLQIFPPNVTIMQRKVI